MCCTFGHTLLSQQLAERQHYDAEINKTANHNPPEQTTQMLNKSRSKLLFKREINQQRTADDTQKMVIENTAFFFKDILIPADPIIPGQNYSI